MVESQLRRSSAIVSVAKVPTEVDVIFSSASKTGLASSFSLKETLWTLVDKAWISESRGCLSLMEDIPQRHDRAGLESSSIGLRSEVLALARLHYVSDRLPSRLFCQLPFIIINESKITVDRFSEDLPSFMGYDYPRPSLSSSSSYRPQSSSHFSRPQHDPPRSHHPPTPPTLPSLPVPIYPGQPIDPVRKITPPEEKEIYAEDKKLATANEYKSPYDEAYAYFQECRAQSSRFAPCAPRPLEDYERPLAIKISKNDWIKLSSDLNWGESDEA
jgi:hypothetical protein